MDVAAEFLASNGNIMLSDYPYDSGYTGLDGACDTTGMTTYDLQTGTGYTFVDYGLSAFTAALLI